MQIGSITIDGRPVGVVSLTDGDVTDTFTPDLDGYSPQGRASEAPDQAQHDAPKHDGGAPQRAPRRHWVGEHRHQKPPHHFPYRDVPHREIAPSGRTYAGGDAGPRASRGSAETEAAIEQASKAYGLDPNTMKSIASIESSMNPSSNANHRTQYKGLYQIGREEWRRFGEGNIYSARDNAMAAARMFSANRDKFKEHYGRNPTDTELYLMHQQGLGFYTRGAMTNIGGNPYPGMRGPQSQQSFESGWGREVARRKSQFELGAPNQPSESSGHANFMSGAPLPSSEAVKVKTAGGNTFTANPASAPYLQGFVEDLEKAGAPITDIGGHNIRTIAGTNRLSQHAYGNAIDINQQSRNVVSPAFGKWARENPDALRATQRKWGIISGGDWKNPDFGHFEWGGPKHETEPAERLASGETAP
jgi:hypothetical protein